MICWAIASNKQKSTDVMKRMKLKTLGIVLLLGTVMTAGLIQFCGSGLVVTEHINQHIQSSDSRVTLTAIDTTTYHGLRILSLLAIACVGAVFLVVSRRYEKTAS